jgi:hypothetical protein
MLDSSFFDSMIYFFKIGVPCGFSMGFIVWLFAWCISQLFHFFKAISQ